MVLLAALIVAVIVGVVVVGLVFVILNMAEAVLVSGLLLLL